MYIYLLFRAGLWTLHIAKQCGEPVPENQVHVLIIQL
jgi:hypothetical protein